MQSGDVMWGLWLKLTRAEVDAVNNASACLETGRDRVVYRCFCVGAYVLYGLATMCDVRLWLCSR